MSAISQRRCEACGAGAAPLSPDEVELLKPEVPDWHVEEDEVEGVPRLKRAFGFNNYREVIEFSQRVADQAEEQGHHPVLLLGYDSAIVWWWSHKLDGLHPNDFIMAARTDEAAGQARAGG